MPPSAKRSSIVSFWPGGEEDGWPACGWAKSERVKKSGHKKLTRQVFTAAPGSHIPAGKQFIAGGKTGMDLRLQSVANHLLRAGGVSPVARVVGCGLPVVLRDSGAGVRKGARSSISPPLCHPPTRSPPEKPDMVVTVWGFRPCSGQRSGEEKPAPHLAATPIAALAARLGWRFSMLESNRFVAFP